MDGPDDQRELREYLGVLLRQKVVIVVAALISAFTALLLALAQTPVYHATAELLFEAGRARYIVDPASQRVGDPQRLLENEVEFLESDEVARAAEAKVGISGRVDVAVSQPTGDIMLVTAQADDAGDAASIANATAEAYIDQRREQGVEDYRRTIEVTQANLDEVQRAQFEAALRIDELNAELGSPNPDTDVEVLSAERNTLRSNQGTLFDQANKLSANLRALSLGFDLEQSDVATLTRLAEAPSTASSPRPVRNIAVGLVFGLVVGVALAFVRDYLDDSVKTRERLEMFLRGRVPVIAQVPVIGEWRDEDRAVLVSVESPRAPASEAYQTLRTAMSFVSVNDPPQVIQVTSGEPGEGKTTTAANLAVAMIRTGHRVLIVDADLRRPRAHEFFGLAATPGLLEAVETGWLADVVQPVPGVDGLDLLASGGLPPDPSALISTDRFEALFAVMRDRYDRVILDSPPILPVADSLALSRLADTLVVVVDSIKTTTRNLAATLEAIEQVDANVAGVVLNRSNEQEPLYEAYLSHDAADPELSGDDAADPELSGDDSTETGDAPDPDPGDPLPAGDEGHSVP